MPRPLLSESEGYLEHDVRTRLSSRQNRLLDKALEVMVAGEAKRAKAEQRRAVDKSKADVMRLALEHLIDTHPDFAGVSGKAKRGGK